MSPRDDRPVRIGDGDRRRVERRLRAAYLRGELSDDTLERRLEAMHAAQAQADLTALLGDLPGTWDRLRGALARPRRSDAPALVAPRLHPGDRLVLGRSHAADVRFVELSVSRSHAELRRLGDGWLVVDRGSRNGTFVNGVRVQRAHVGDGDEIRLGGASVVLRT